MSPARCLLLLLAAMLPAAVSAQKVYKWTDAKGVTHYADAPPEGVKFERINLSTGQARADREAAESEAAETAANTAAGGVAPVPPAASPQCRQAQANLDTLQNNRRVLKDVDGDGTPEEISGSTLQEEVERARKLVEAYCN